MLVPIMFLLAFMFALATALLQNGLVAAKTALHATVARYSEVAISDGVAQFTGSLAAFVAQHGSSGPWPGAMSHSYPQSLCDPSVRPEQCPFSYTISGEITDVPGADMPAGSNDAVTNVQTSVIGEQRISAVVSVTVSARSGTVLGTRTRLLTYRVFEAAPFAVVSGSRDMTTVNGSRTVAQGDSGGAPAESDSLTAAGTIHDTRIHVQLTCSTVIQNVVPFANDQQAAGNDGLPWGNAPGGGHEAVCHQPASPADAFADKTWTNGNTNASGWTQ